jgi:hypothetical protein
MRILQAYLDVLIGYFFCAKGLQLFTIISLKCQ